MINLVPQTIATRSKLLCASVVAMTLLGGVTAYYVKQALLSQLNDTRTIGGVLTNYIKLDMVHDEARSTVLRSVANNALGVTKADAMLELENILAEARDFGTALKQSVTGLPKEMQDEILAGKPQDDLYFAQVEKLVNLAFADAAKATYSLPAFERSFEEFKTRSDLVRDMLQQRSDRINNEALNVSQNASYAVTATMLFAFVCIGALVAFLLIAILRPLHRLRNSMIALKNGDTTIRVDGYDRGDEIGEMARAVAVFRDNAAAKDQVDAQLRAEEAKQVAAEKERRRLEEIAGIEVNDMVAAAAAGDFTRRIDVTGKIGFFNKLGLGVNSLVEGVGSSIGEVVTVISSIARGDLSRRVEGDFKGAFLELKTDTNSMADKIRAIARRISSATGSVQGTTGEIAAGVLDLSSRTEHQASSLEQTSASMEEMAATVRQSASNALEANELASGASTMAQSGGEVAKRAVAAMARIEESSNQITEIVSLIQDIAFQTNLLALNAAVEAARAGDAGKGFAVVANEVRALAQRAGQASKDIRGLIGASNAQVREGASLVKQAGSSLNDIVASVKKVAVFVSEIAAAAQEQSAGIEQVSRAVSGMDQTTQQNAALVEETNAALQSAQAQVEELRSAVAFFDAEDKLAADSVAVPEVARIGVPATRLAPANPVRQQMEVLTRRVSGGYDKPVGDWKEF